MIREWLACSIRALEAGPSRDPVLLLTVAYIHEDLSKLEARSRAFERAPKSVQTAVMARLDQIIAFHQVGHFTAGASALVAGCVGILTAIVAFSVAGYSGLLSALTKLTNASTGKVTGITTKEFGAVVGEIGLPMAVAAGIVLLLLILNIYLGHSRDRRRAAAVAWRDVYTRLLCMKIKGNQTPA